VWPRARCSPTAFDYPQSSIQSQRSVGRSTTMTRRVHRILPSNSHVSPFTDARYEETPNACWRRPAKATERSLEPAALCGSRPDMHQVRGTGLANRRRLSIVQQVALETYPNGLPLKNSSAAFFECFLLKYLGLIVVIWCDHLPTGARKPWPSRLRPVAVRSR
jgi:hypothetical protein